MKKLFILLICFVGLFTLAACNEDEPKEVEHVVKETIDVTELSKTDAVRFSSFFTGAEKGLERYVKQVAPYDDTYTITTSETTTCDLYDATGKLLVSVDKNATEEIKLEENQVVYSYVTTANAENAFSYEVSLKDHHSLFPYPSFLIKFHVRFDL